MGAGEEGHQLPPPLQALVALNNRMKMKQSGGAATVIKCNNLSS
jgi:hypothetical protein